MSRTARIVEIPGNVDAGLCRSRGPAESCSRGKHSNRERRGLPPVQRWSLRGWFGRHQAQAQRYSGRWVSTGIAAACAPNRRTQAAGAGRARHGRLRDGAGAAAVDRRDRARLLPAGDRGPRDRAVRLRRGRPRAPAAAPHGRRVGWLGGQPWGCAAGRLPGRGLPRHGRAAGRGAVRGTHAHAAHGWRERGSSSAGTGRLLAGPPPTAAPRSSRARGAVASGPAPGDLVYPPACAGPARPSRGAGAGRGPSA